MKFKLLLSLILVMPYICFAQDSEIGNWWIYFGDKKINDDFNWHHEVQYRNYNFIGDLEQLLIRTGVGYNLTENNNNFLIGYGFIRSDNYINEDDKVSNDEHRVYQQFITKQSIGRVSVLHRYRFEQRFFEDDFRMRYRYFLTINIPLNHNRMIENTFYLSSYNEIFINHDEEVDFDRNRIYGGLGFKRNNHLRFEIGYMNQILAKTARDQLNIIAFVNF